MGKEDRVDGEEVAGLWLARLSETRDLKEVVRIAFVEFRVGGGEFNVGWCLVKLNANRVVVGTLRGFDQFMNLVIDNTMEINGNEKNDIGMVLFVNLIVMIEALEPVARSQ
ncbi:hypothetical protein Scep_027426 [Stephania cephalantha]|uniref:Sm protein G n=1 Tax=Stephania cephalantha TaxID=152367 RepID=A0AAP0EGC5_9MAGN